jgi:preprotein translocase subunit SecE
VKDFLPLLIGAVLVGGLFAYLWTQGHIARLSAYVADTRDELRKCSWPSREELVQSTVLIFVVIALLGVFTVAVDFLTLGFVKTLLKAT